MSCEWRQRHASPQIRHKLFPLMTHKTSKSNKIHRHRRRRRRFFFSVFGRHVQRITYVKQRLLRARRRYILIRTTCRFQVCARTATFACTQYELLVDRPQKQARGRENGYAAKKERAGVQQQMKNKTNILDASTKLCSETKTKREKKNRVPNVLNALSRTKTRAY